MAYERLEITFENKKMILFYDFSKTMHEGRMVGEGYTTYQFDDICFDYLTITKDGWNVPNVEGGYDNAMNELYRALSIGIDKYIKFEDLLLKFGEKGAGVLS